jgi:hypothetical protein
VGGVRNQDLGAGLALLLMIGRDHQHSGQFALGAGRRLKADGRQTGHFGQVVLQLVHQFQGPLAELLGQQGMGAGKPGRDAWRSLVLGLYFMVQDPSG